VGLLEGEGMMSDLHKLTATEARSLLAKGSISAEELVRSCLARIEAREPNVAAWQYLNPELAIRQARERDALPADTRASKLLNGIPVGIKDICDTADMPTCYGARARLGHQPAIDATCVAQTRAAGGVVMGKTVTTEFAGRYPGVTSNPHDPRRTPGGSSSGSAAAVADFMVPLAIGTQTGGSVLRPATYCGVFGYKPTFGHLSFEGVHHGAETFDTLGCMARSLDDIKLFRHALMGFAILPAAPPAVGTPVKIGFCKTSKWNEADKSTHALLEGAASRLASAGAAVSELVLPAEFDELYDLTAKLFAVEYARAVTPELLQSPENMSSAVMTMIENAAQISPETYMTGLARLDALRVTANAVMDKYDVVLTPSVGGEAPMTHDSTGPVTFTIIWQALSLPGLTMPVYTGPNGMPVGVQLVGKRHKDVELLAVADWVWRELGRAA
jgi:Asp-tRNA(Asn)/Glu-tRNA(Gln) amidotransferase A subunit family amidase